MSAACGLPITFQIGVFGGGCEPLILGKRRPYIGPGVRNGIPFERAMVSSYIQNRPSVYGPPPLLILVTFPLSPQGIGGCP